MLILACRRIDFNALTTSVGFRTGNSVTSVFCTPEDENQSWQVLGEAFQL